MSLFYIKECVEGGQPFTDIGFTEPKGGATYDELTNQGVYRTGRRPVFEDWKGDLYLGGSYTRVMVRHATDRRWLPAGITPPQSLLSVVPGSGSGGSSGSALAYITFLHKEGLRVLAESNPSNVVNVGDLTGEGRLWDDIPAVGAELRVTHVRGYVSMNGARYRMAWESPYGITTIEENVRTARLSLSGLSGGSGDFRNGVPPIGIHYIHPWAGRMWYANNSEFPYRLWYSLPGRPQYVGRAQFRDTFEREPITGIWRGRNELVVFCQDNSYLVRQFGGGLDDFVLERLDSNVGSLTHHSIKEIHNRLWFAARDGVWIYDGNFHYVMEDLRLLWEQEYCNNRTAFDGSFATYDKLNKVYLLWTPRPAVSPPEWEEKSGLNARTVVYVAYIGNFEPSIGGTEKQPDWTLDFKDREDSSSLYGRNNEMFVASCDGNIRRQIKACEIEAFDPLTDARTDFGSDDDADTLQKKVIVRHGHMLMFQPGDDVQSGKKLQQLWMHVQSETTPWTLFAMGGDETTWQSVRPDNAANERFWKFAVPASEQREVRTIDGSDFDFLFCSKSVHFFIPEKVAGRGFTFESQVVDSIAFVYRGVGGLWGAGGVAYRPPRTVTVV